MKIRNMTGLLLSLIGAIGSPTALSTPSTTTAENTTITVASRRLNAGEYRNSIWDIFGDDIAVNARFEPEKREGGLFAIGNAELSLTSSGFEQYFTLASNVAEQVFADTDFKSQMLCKPKSAAKADAQCAAEFIEHYGELIFRRPLNAEETQVRVALAKRGAEQAGDFYAGLHLALVSLLTTPDFLFRVERAEPDPATPGEYRLDGYTKAARLSFLFWNTAPDAELLAAARSGELHTEKGLQKQLTRLSESPRLQVGARAFFADMLQLDGFENMVKDPAIYPKFNQQVADSAREQMLKTAVGLLVEKNRDYRELFRSNETYINRPLASIYKVPYASAQEWMPFEFDDNSERAGILTQVGFLSLFAHPGTSSPTRRGIKLHEIFMCEPTPDPPADVDFSKVQAMLNGTVRERLLDHMENTGCTACHRRSDPPGLALEYFDGIGQLRKYENGFLIDVSADFNGVQLEGAPGLADYLYEDKRVPACLVQNVYSYGTGRATDFWDEDYLADQSDAFAAGGYRYTQLLKQIASTPEFFKVHMPEGIALKQNNDNTTAQLAQ